MRADWWTAASKITAVKYQVLGETHGLPYLATLYCAQGHWHRSCLSCCYMLRIEANKVFTFTSLITLVAWLFRNSIKVSTHLLINVRIVFVLSLCASEQNSRSFETCNNFFVLALKCVNCGCSKELETFQCWHNVDENEVVYKIGNIFGECSSIIFCKIKGVHVLVHSRKATKAQKGSRGIALRFL
jgi:hypothetical protein